MMQSSRAPRLQDLEKTAGSEVYVSSPPHPDTAYPSVILRMIDLFDGSRSVAAVCGEVQISVGRGVAAVRKLNASGVLRRVELHNRADLDNRADLERADTLRDLTPLPADTHLTQAPSITPTGFTDEEEAFFASDVTPIDLCDEPFLTLRERIGLAFSGLLGCRANAA